jgi:lysyl-tRNA synthetase class I
MKIATFRAKCQGSTCRLEFDAPVLSDFSYGEFIYSSVDSEQIRYYCGFGCETWKFIDTIVAGYFEKKNREEMGAVIQRIIGLVADRQNSEAYYTQAIYCPKCHLKVDSIDDNDRTGTQEYEDLTFDSFMRLTELKRKILVDKLLSEL